MKGMGSGRIPGATIETRSKRVTSRRSCSWARAKPGFGR